MYTGIYLSVLFTYVLMWSILFFFWKISFFCNFASGDILSLSDLHSYA